MAASIAALDLLPISVIPGGLVNGAAFTD